MYVNFHAVTYVHYQTFGILLFKFSAEALQLFHDHSHLSIVWNVPCKCMDEYQEYFYWKSRVVLWLKNTVEDVSQQDTRFKRIWHPVHQCVMQIAAKKVCFVGILQLELGRELMALSQKMVYGLIILVVYLTLYSLVFTDTERCSPAKHLVLGIWEIFWSLQLRIHSISGLKYLGSKDDTNALVLFSQVYWNHIFWFQISFEISGVSNLTRAR